MLNGISSFNEMSIRKCEIVCLFVFLIFRVTGRFICGASDIALARRLNQFQIFFAIETSAFIRQILQSVDRERERGREKNNIKQMKIVNK